MRDKLKRKLLSEIHVLVESWRPFAAEIALLWPTFRDPTCVDGSQSGK
jgi:hypothetical protein